MFSNHTCRTESRRFKVVISHATANCMHKPQLCIGMCCLKLVFVLFCIRCVCTCSWHFSLHFMFLNRTRRTESRRYKKVISHAVANCMHEPQLCIGMCCLKLVFVLFCIRCVCAVVLCCFRLRLCCDVPSCIVLCCIVLCCSVLCCTVLCCLVLYVLCCCLALLCLVLSCSIMYCDALYCVILLYSVVWCIVCCVVSCCLVLARAVSCCSMLSCSIL